LKLKFKCNQMRRLQLQVAESKYSLPLGGWQTVYLNLKLWQSCAKSIHAVQLQLRRATSTTTTTIALSTAQLWHEQKSTLGLLPLTPGNSCGCAIRCLNLLLFSQLYLIFFSDFFLFFLPFVWLGKKEIQNRKTRCLL